MIASPIFSMPGTGARAAGKRYSSVKQLAATIERARRCLRASSKSAYLVAGSHSQSTIRRTTGSTSSSVGNATSQDRPPGGQPDGWQVGLHPKAFQRRDERHDEGHQQRQYQRADDRSIARRQLPAPGFYGHLGFFPEVSGPVAWHPFRRSSGVTARKEPGWMRCLTSDAYGTVFDPRALSSQAR